MTKPSNASWYISPDPWLVSGDAVPCPGSDAFESARPFSGEGLDLPGEDDENIILNSSDSVVPSALAALCPAGWFAKPWGVEELPIIHKEIK